MRGWTVQEFGHWRNVLQWKEDLPEATPSGAAVQIRVHAAGVNFPDILSIAGKYQMKADLPFTPGTEVAGEVIATGPEATLRVGDRVVAMTLTGAFAETCTVLEPMCFRLPDAAPYDVAAAMLVTYQSAHLALLRRAGLKPGETVLIHGGAGGVGTAAIHLAKAYGARVVATAHGADKLAVCREAGADAAIDYGDPDWPQAVRAATGGRGTDIVIDPVGGDVFDASIRLLAWEGRLVVVGFTSGRIPEIAANRILLKNIGILGVNWPNYQIHNRSALQEAHDDCWRLWHAGQLAPLISQRLPLRELPTALEALETRRATGKIVLMTTTT